MPYNQFEWRDRVSRARRNMRQGTSTSDGPPKYPTFDPYPEGGGYTTPGYDRRRVENLTQQQAAPQISQLNRKVQNVGARFYKNPLERKEAIRGATEGYGGAISNIMAGARTAGAAAYAPEYAEAAYAARREADDLLRKRMIDWQTGKEEALGKYESEMATYRTDMEDQYRREAISRARGNASDARWRARVGVPFRPAAPIRRVARPGEPGYRRTNVVAGKTYKAGDFYGGGDEGWAKAGGLNWESGGGKSRVTTNPYAGDADEYDDTGARINPRTGTINVRDKYGAIVGTKKPLREYKGYTVGSINS